MLAASRPTTFSLDAILTIRGAVHFIVLFIGDPRDQRLGHLLRSVERGAVHIQLGPQEGPSRHIQLRRLCQLPPNSTTTANDQKRPTPNHFLK